MQGKRCKWCGEPLVGHDARRKFHKGECTRAKNRFHQALSYALKKYIRDDLSTHERLYYLLFSRIQALKAHCWANSSGHGLYLSEVLSVREWQLLADMVAVADERGIPANVRGGARTRELAMIARAIIDMPCEAAYRDLPKNTRIMLNEYQFYTLGFWTRGPDFTITRSLRGGTDYGYSIRNRLQAGKHFPHA